MQDMWPSVVEALSWFSAILVNKICKIMKIFEQLEAGIRASQISQECLLRSLSVGRRPTGF